MKQFITDDEIEKALNYLRDSAPELAQWKGRAKYLEHHRKSVRSMAYLEATGKNISECTAQAEASTAYKQVLTDYQEAIQEMTLLEARRAAAQAKLDIWRSLNASNRQGNI